MPEILERCIRKVMDQGYDKDAAWGICRKATGLAADGSDDKKELSLTDEELDTALYPHLAPKKSESRIVNYALADKIEDDLGDSSHVVDILPNGDVMKEVPIALMGKDFQNGPYSFDLTEENLAVIIRNFEERGQPIPFTFGHFPAEERQRQPAAGWIHKLFARDGKLWGLLKFLKNTWDKVAAGEYKGFSIEFWTNTTDEHGEEIGMVIDGGALTNYPFFPVRVDNAKQTGHRLYTCTAFTGHGAGTERSKSVGGENDATKTVEKDGQRVTLSQKFFEEHYEAAVRDVEGLRGELVQLRADITKKQQTIEAQANEIRGRRIQAAVYEVQTQGVVVPLGDYPIFASHNEAIAWLATCPAPFYVDTVEGLEKFAKDKERVGALRKISKDAPLPSGSIEDISAEEKLDLSTKEAQEAAIRDRVRKYRASYESHEIAVLTRKYGSLEAFALADLKADFPSVKFLTGAK